MKSLIGTKTEATIRQESFGINDARGRMIGARIATREIDFIAAPEDCFSWYNIAAGHYFAVTFHATRNGIPYGACQPEKHFQTAGDREQEIARYLKYALKKAQGGK